MSRVIIIEGTDGVGKTTYAKYLARALDGIYMHAGAPTKPTAHEEYVEPILAHLTNEEERPLILDRWHIGEMVWPDLFGRPSLFGEGQDAIDAFAQTNRILAATDEVEVQVVYRDLPAIKATLEERGEDEKDIRLSVEAQGVMIHVALDAMMENLPVELVNSDNLPSAPRFEKGRI